MIRIKNRSVSIVALLFSIALASSAAMSFGPQYQVIGDPVAAGAGPLNDVVSLVNAGGIELGTGSLIGVSTPAPGGLTFMSILTARHVAVDAVKTAPRPRKCRPRRGRCPRSGCLSAHRQPRRQLCGLYARRSSE